MSRSMEIISSLSKTCPEMISYRVFLRPFIVILAFSIAATTSAQQAAPLSPHDAEIKHRADGLKPQAKISIVLQQGGERFGSFLSNDAEAFMFFDIDQNVQATVKYAEIKKIKNGYGGYNSIHQRHTDRTQGLVVTIIVLGALGGLIAAAAAAKD